MNRSIAILTAAMTLSHAVLGCCAQAVQGAGCCDKVPSVCSDHHEHKPSHVGDSHEPLDERTPGRGHECCRVKCQWLAPDAVGDLTHELLGHSAIFDEDPISSSRSSNFFQNLDLPADTLFALPVRSHLALGVLLI